MSEDTDSARSNRDAQVVSGKQARLREKHIAPITELVEVIRQERGHEFVPYVDPTLSGVNARILFLLETPARPAALSSRMLSPDNNDSTAANVWELYRQSGLPRDKATHWNAVPWFLGDESRNRNARHADILEGIPWLARMIDLLPQLRLVIAMGRVAQRSFALYLLRSDARLLPWFAVAHPSGRVRHANPSLWNDMSTAFLRAADIARR